MTPMKNAQRKGTFQRDLAACHDAQNMAHLALAESVLNTSKKHLSTEAKKRLHWIYVLEYEAQKNVSRAVKKIGISREWLSV